MPVVLAPIEGDDWLGLTADSLPIGALYEPLTRTVAGDALDTASRPAAD